MWKAGRLSPERLASIDPAFQDGENVKIHDELLARRIFQLFAKLGNNASHGRAAENFDFSRVSKASARQRSKNRCYNDCAESHDEPASFILHSSAPDSGFCEFYVEGYQVIAERSQRTCSHCQQVPACFDLAF